MKYGTISFKDLKEGNYEFQTDGNSCMMVGISIDVNSDSPEDVGNTLEQGLHDCGFVTTDAKPSALLRVTGNVKGDEGRWDWVIVFDKDPKFNCIRRFQTPWPIKWISDFIDNYAGDFVCD